MKSISFDYLKIILILLFIYFAQSAFAAEKCALSHQLTDSSKKIHCLDKFDFSKRKYSNFNMTLDIAARSSNCWSVAIPIEESCNNIIGFSAKDPLWCMDPGVRKQNNKSALSMCNSKGCKCSLVIDANDIVDTKLFFSYAMRESDLVVQNNPEKGANESINNKSELKNSQPEKNQSIINSEKEKQIQQDLKLVQEIKAIEDVKEKEQQELKLAQEAKRQREQAKQSSRISITASSTQPDSSGVVTITVQTNTDTSSLKINGNELGAKTDGSYVVKRVARVGQETRFILAATDIYGNTDTKTITVSRAVVESKVTYPELNPERIKRQPERDAVAVIIGISNYKSLPKADFAKDDAQVFYDYAIRALGVRPGNIKLLMDEQADAEEIYTAFKTWLPARVKSTTDVYVFYSGHGLPTQDGSGLYWLPQRANRDVIAKTAILLQDINIDIQASKPKSVTIFMDACYSGQARGGETLVASARPIALKSQPTTFPSNFTIISASQADQISSSSPELQHGIFSYYLMRGMEGEADLNKDGKITLDEIQAYLSENVGRQARTMNRQQEPQVIGDGSRVLVGR